MNKDKHKEVLVLTMEECGELIQACSKVIRTMDDPDCDDKWVKNLEEEVGDVMCMVEILHMAGLVDEDKLMGRMKRKKKKLERWSTIFE